MCSVALRWCPNSRTYRLPNRVWTFTYRRLIWKCAISHFDGTKMPTTIGHPIGRVGIYAPSLYMKARNFTLGRCANWDTIWLPSRVWALTYRRLIWGCVISHFDGTQMPKPIGSPIGCGHLRTVVYYGSVQLRNSAVRKCPNLSVTQ